MDGHATESEEKPNGRRAWPPVVQPRGISHTIRAQGWGCTHNQRASSHLAYFISGTYECQMEAAYLSERVGPQTFAKCPVSAVLRAEQGASPGKFIKLALESIESGTV